MYFLLNMWIFHKYIGLSENINIILSENIVWKPVKHIEALLFLLFLNVWRFFSKDTGMVVSTQEASKDIRDYLWPKPWDLELHDEMGQSASVSGHDALDGWDGWSTSFPL